MLRGILRLREGIGDHDGHVVTHIAHLALRQCRVPACPHGRAILVVDHPAADEPADLVRRDVIASEDGQHAGHGGGLLGVDLLDVRMGVRRTQEIGMGLPRTVDIVRVIALAGDEAEIFLARNARADSSGRHDAPPELAAFRRVWPIRAA